MRLDGGGLRISSDDSVLVDADREGGTQGRATALPDELSRPDARRPTGAGRGVDLRHKGHPDLHIWSSSATLSVTSYRRVVP